MNRLYTSLFFLLTLFVPCMAQQANIGFVFPASATRGSVCVVEIGGQGIANSADVLISGKGISCEVMDAPELSASQKQQKNGKKGKKIITDEDNLQLADRIFVRLKIAKNAELGMRDIKVVSAKGTISNRLYFEVVSPPSFVESEPNGTLATANQVPATPMVLNGQVERGGRDCYSFYAQKGQDIVAEVYARHFVPYLADAVPGWFQAVLALYDESGREVAFSDDYALAPDPVLFYTIPQDGRYTLEIKDSIYRGREDFVYRIAVGEIPFVQSVFPLGGSVGQECLLSLTGKNLKETSIKYSLPKEKGRLEQRFEGSKGGMSNPVTLQVSDKEEIIIAEDAGDDSRSAMLFTAGQVINAKIESDRDHDWYAFDMEADQSLIFDVEARRLGSPLDARLCLYNKKGELLQECDDTEDDSEGMITHHADPQMLFTSPKKGRYFLRLSDTQNKYGQDFAYRLSVKESKPSFSLRIEPSAISIPQGGTSHFTIFVTRENDFKGDITLNTQNLPKGFVLNRTDLPRAAKQVKMHITAPLDAEVGRLNPIFEGQGQNGLKSGRSNKLSKFPMVQAVAQPVEAMLQAFYITHLLPTQEFRMDVIEAQEFQLEILNKEALQLQPNKGVELKVAVHRQKGFDREIQLMAKGTPKGIDVDAITISPKENEVSLFFIASSWKKASLKSDLYLVGTVGASTKTNKGDNKKIKADIMVNSPGFTLIAPSQEPPQDKKDKQKKDKK